MYQVWAIDIFADDLIIFKKAIKTSIKFGNGSVIVRKLDPGVMMCDHQSCHASRERLTEETLAEPCREDQWEKTINKSNRQRRRYKIRDDINLRDYCHINLILKQKKKNI